MLIRKWMYTFRNVALWFFIFILFSWIYWTILLRCQKFCFKNCKKVVQWRFFCKNELLVKLNSDVGSYSSTTSSDILYVYSVFSQMFFMFCKFYKQFKMVMITTLICRVHLHITQPCGPIKSYRRSHNYLFSYCNESE